jgi:peptide chain release factor 1
MVDRIAVLEAEMAQPEVATDHRKYRKLADEHGRLRRIVALGENFFRLSRDLAEHRSLINDPGGDAELIELAASEAPELEEKVAEAETKLNLSLLPPDPNDSRNAIVEIRAGTGGDEACLFAGDLYRMYGRFAEERGWKVSIVDASTSTIGGYKEVVFTVEGDGVYHALKYESGGHRVQRVPATETQGRIHTSAATVAVFPEADAADDLEIAAEDIRVDIFRSSGPGGQSVNTTDSAVRLTHLPTGIVVQSQDERSQHRNKDKAMTVLRARILDWRQRQEAERRASERRTLIGSGDRSQRIRTYNFSQNRLTDHRINLTIYSLDRVIEGEIADLINALDEHDNGLRLEEFMKSD